MIDGKIATIFHGIDISSREVLNHYTPEYQQLFRRGDMMLPISDLWAGRLKNMGCPGEKITVSRMGVDMERFTQRAVKVPGKPLQIISVARLTEKKGLHVAIEACQLLKSRGIPFRYRILGIGPWERRLKTLITQFGLDDQVEMCGFCPSEVVKTMLDDADLFLLPSVTGTDGDMEGIPVALMEAMAVGIPVISTVHSGIPELVESGKSGWLAPEIILYMAFVALANFTQPSYELGYAIKFMRVMLLVLTAISPVWGFWLGIALMLIIMASNRTTRLFSLSVDRSLPVGRSWRQKASRFEKRGKIRSTGYSVFKVL